MKLSFLDLMPAPGQGWTVPGQWQVLRTFNPCIKPKDERWVFGGYSSGGRIINFNEEFLLVSVGDHEIDGMVQAAVSQDLQNDYGKIWKVNKNTGEGEIYASGVRNPQGLYIDRSGKIWDTEHGPRGGDDLNWIRKDHDYGWPQQTYGIYYGNKPWHPNKIQGSHKLFTQPVFSWLPSIGVSNLTQNDPTRFPLWSDDLIVSSLMNQSLYRLRMGEARVIYVEPIRIGSRIRDIITLTDGRLALFTTRSDSSILIIDQLENVFDQHNKAVHSRIDQKQVTRPVPGHLQNQFARGKEQFKESCSACHRVNGLTVQAPALNGLFARKVGSVTDFTYSQTLTSLGELQWTPKLLKEYLLRVSPRFKGSSMPVISLNTKQIKDLSTYLEYL